MLKRPASVAPWVGALSVVAAVLMFPVSSMATSFTYTVNWNTIPGDPTIMPTATFEFTVSELAATNGSIPLGEVTIVNSPCGSGSSYTNISLYGVNTFSIGLNCIISGYSNYWKGTLYGTTADITGPGTYAFTYSSLEVFATEGLYDIDSPRLYTSYIENYGGSVTVTETVVPEPATLLLLGTGLLGAVRSVRRRRG